MHEVIIFKSKISKGAIFLPYLIFFLILQFEDFMKLDFTNYDSWMILIFVSFFCLIIQLSFIITVKVTNKKLIFKRFLSIICKNKSHQIDVIEEVVIYNYWAKFSFPFMKIKEKGGALYTHYYFPLSNQSISILANVLERLGIDVALLNSPTD